MFIITVLHAETCREAAALDIANSTLIDPLLSSSTRDIKSVMGRCQVPITVTLNTKQLLPMSLQWKGIPPRKGKYAKVLSRRYEIPEEPYSFGFVYYISQWRGHKIHPLNLSDMMSFDITNIVAATHYMMLTQTERCHK